MNKVYKTNELFEQCLAKADQGVVNEVRLNITIANRIVDILKRKGMSQRQFASLLGKKESEISRWLNGSKGFTTTTLAKMSIALGEDIISVTSDVIDQSAGFTCSIVVKPVVIRKYDAPHISFGNPISVSSIS